MTDLTTVNGAAVPRNAFGTMQFGGKADETQSAEMFEAARAAGIRHFDTAYVYTGGKSETILGELAKDCRDDLFIATKVAMRTPSSRDNINAQFDTCRTRLGMDMVDLLYIHIFDPDTDLSETFAALADLQSAGKIRYIGVSNYAAWQVMKAQAIAKSLGTRIDVLQPMYNLVKRQSEVELLPMCADQNILAAPYSPLGGGLLTGKYASGQSGRLTEDDMYLNRYAVDAMHRAAGDLVDIANDLGTSPATLAVAWVAAHPSRPAPILSARTAKQLQPSLDGLGYQMTPDLYARLSAIYPAPAPATDRLEEA